MSENKEIVPAPKAIVPIKDGQFQPTDLEGMYRLADIMAQSGLVPKNFNNNAPMVFVACQMGMELGLSPMAAVQNIAVINGNPSLYGDALLAIVTGSGVLEDFDEKSSGTIEDDDYKCICTAKRKGRKNPIIREFGIDDATRAGLWQNKDVWKKYPKRMLQMRARAWCLRDGFPDLLKGIKSAEEVNDYSQPNDYPEAEIVEEKKGIKFDTSKYDKCLDEKNLNYPVDLLNEFVTKTADTIGVSEDELKSKAGEDFEDFWKNFCKWCDKNQG